MAAAMMREMFMSFGDLDRNVIRGSCKKSAHRTVNHAISFGIARYGTWNMTGHGIEPRSQSDACRKKLGRGAWPGRWSRSRRVDRHGADHGPRSRGARAAGVD